MKVTLIPPALSLLALLLVPVCTSACWAAGPAASRYAAHFGLRILAGKKPSQIGVQEIRNKEQTLWDLYRWQIIAVILLCVIQAALITGLIVQRFRRVRAERRLRQAVDVAPNGMLMVGRNGDIVLANARMESLFGYRRDEMIGKPVELLVPMRFRDEHKNLRRGFFDSPAARIMGTGREVFGRRKDGSEFPIEIGLNPLQTEKGLLVLASVVDISQKRQAEHDLHESRAALQELAGKLLGAQETERRRIARELHDDLGQGLALLSVELDLLQQNLPETASGHGTRMEAMSEQVKRLSTSIHDLSHQLHPMKLEQLGLVAAVRSLCAELTQAHGIKIEFSQDDLPVGVSPETAICLYRIAQEALRNVIKHSGARCAEVELRNMGNAVGLTVRDDGKGFEPSAASRQEGLGLASMRERARLVNGEFTVDSRRAGGTRIDVRVPLVRHGADKVES